MTADNKRIYRTKSEKQEIISNQQASNLAVKDFCEREGFHVNQFYLWRRQLQCDASPSSRNNFIELRPPQHSFALEILLPNGVLIRGNQPELILNTVTTLLHK